MKPDLDKFANWLCYKAIHEPATAATLLDRIANGYRFRDIADAVTVGNPVHLSEVANMGVMGAAYVIEDYQEWGMETPLPF